MPLSAWKGVVEEIFEVKLVAISSVRMYLTVTLNDAQFQIGIKNIFEL